MINLVNKKYVPNRQNAVFFNLLMARISEQIIEQIRSTADIIEVVSGYVQLKKRGRNYFGLCPFHGEKTPSFSVSPERQIYKCFGCSVGGGVINFIMEIEGMEFVNAVKHLADQYSIELQIDESAEQSKDLITQLFEIHSKTAQTFLNNLGTEEGSKVLAHLESRGLTRETIKKFKLGYSMKQNNALLLAFRKEGVGGKAMQQSGLFIDTKNGYMDKFRGRIMFSIYNSAGKIAAFAGRVFESDDPAKYINSPETPIYNKSKILYGLHETKQKIRESKSVIVVEGYLDFLQLYQSGIHNIVAVSGTAFTDQHALQIKRFCEKVHLAYDGDSAGKAAAIRAGYVLLRAGLLPLIANIPDGFDPDDWVKRDGNTPFLKAVENAEKLLLFHFQNYKGDITTTSGKTAFVNDVLMEIVQIKDPVSRELQGRELSEIVGVSAESIFQSLHSMLEKLKRRQSFQKNNKSPKPKTEDKKQLLENDLIRICFAEDITIRKFLFDNVKPEWLVTDLSQKIYEKVYIHLHSANAPEPSLIMDELKNEDHRNKLAELVFDLEKITPSLKSAEDCVRRLEQNWLNIHIQSIREELKNAESSGSNPLPLMKKIDEFQSRKNNLSRQYPADE
ncbi:MAG: DNA primase [Candidatus Marinimicrobia bacterium]|nr:DNA primase [Candidatus Neomarinimicrobiota bacterium]